MRRIVVCAAAIALLAAAQLASAQRVDIFTALKTGGVRAEFRGNGDASVIATITRLPGGPTEVTIPPGSVFRVPRTREEWDQLAQFGGYGGRWGGYGGYGGLGGRGYGGYRGYGGRGGRFGQGGRQGMYGYRGTTARLAFANTAELLIPAVCMDYNKPAPTPADPMLILPPTPQLARLAAVVAANGAPQPAIQLAVWALLNHAPRAAATRYLAEIIPGRSAAIQQQRAELMDVARSLLIALDVQPADLPMFR